MAPVDQPQRPTPGLDQKLPERPRDHTAAETQGTPDRGHGSDSTPASNAPLSTSVEKGAEGSRSALGKGRSSRQQSLATEDDGGFPEELEGPPPAYTESLGRVSLEQSGFNTNADLGNDGRVNINIQSTSTRLSSLLVPALRSQLRLSEKDVPKLPPGYIPPSLGGIPGKVPPPPPMDIVIHVVGSRGDVQPFVALGQVLRDTYGHRIRLATHEVFRDFVQENGLEFFSIGGDPAELMAFMVKNPGLMPGMDALKSGDVGRRRRGIYEIIRGCWRSCFEAGDGTGPAISDEHHLDNFDPHTKPFVADAIIANPPSFAHIHCAEKLGIPLHLMFTMPWSPTTAFPHPLANIESSNVETSITNFVSYILIEMMTWQGLGDIINAFRERVLGLEEISLIWAPTLASRLKIPFTYCWSPSLIPKPNDWASHIFISGFYFLSLGTNFTPDPDLAAFLAAGPPPVYIGFGSIVLDDPNAMTKTIFDAVRASGQRALVSKGWGGFGADELGVPENVFMLGNVPHDWLFRQVSCVVHHGGAGTMSAGIALGKPTIIVPFFGDQPFWGSMIARAGAGPKPIPHKELTSERLAAAIEAALQPDMKARAEELAAKIATEKGTDLGAKRFHDVLDVDSLRCSFAPSRIAVWRVKRTQIRLCAFAASVLVNAGLLGFDELKLYRSKEYTVDEGPIEPISGAAAALVGTAGNIMMGVADVPMYGFKSFQRRNTKAKPGENDASKTKSDDDTSSITRSSTKDETDLSRSTSKVTNNNDAATVDPAEQPPQSPGSTSLAPTEERHRSDPLADAETEAEAKSPEASNAAKKQAQEDRIATWEAAIASRKGVGRIAKAAIKSPMDFTLALAKGFHNTPKLYGDTTVRQPDRVTDLQSGLKAAGKEFGYGMYDGISGFVTQPMQGAKKEGLSGFLKGFGKGIGGLVLKPGGAFWALTGYTFQGLYREIQSKLGVSVQNYIIAARTAQGIGDMQAATEAERADVVARWHDSQDEITRQRRSWLQRARTTRNLTNEQQQAMAQEMGVPVPSPAASPAPNSSSMLAPPPSTQSTSSTSPSNRSTNSLSSLQPGSASSSHAPSMSSATTNALASSVGDFDPRTADPADMESAIQAAVRQTSTGNAREDAVIERAIRASLAHLHQSQTKASTSDTNPDSASAGTGVAARSDDDDLDPDLKEAIERSLQDKGGPRAHDWDDDSGADTEDEQYQQALRASLASQSPDKGRQREPTMADPETSRSLPQHESAKQSDEGKPAASTQEHGADIKRQPDGRSEEEIVLEYVKKQSLLEEEHRRALQK